MDERKFWEKWGFTEHLAEGIWRYELYHTTNYWWESPGGRKYKDLPPITLDNLFKYCAPQLPSNLYITLTKHGDRPHYYARVDGFYADSPRWVTSSTDPAQALAEALAKVVRSKP